MRNVRIALIVGPLMLGVAAAAWSQPTSAPVPPAPACEERVAAGEIRRQVGDQVEARYALELARTGAELARVRAQLEAAEQRIRLEIPEAPGKAPAAAPAKPSGPKKK
jgi:hypothetical protein